MPKKHTFKAAFQNAGGRGEFLDHKNSEISKISEFCFIYGIQFSSEPIMRTSSSCIVALSNSLFEYPT